MKTIESETVILASAEKIWDILLDFDRYQEWNPFIKSLSGRPETGERLKATLQLEDRKPMVFKPKVMAHAPQKEFRWLGHLIIPGLFDGEHMFLLEPIAQGQVKFIQRENFKGMMANLFLKKIGPSTQTGFEAMNQALKQRAEAA